MSILEGCVRIMGFSGYYGDDVFQAQLSILRGLDQGVRIFSGDFLSELTMAAFVKGVKFARSFSGIAVPLLEALLAKNAIILVNAGGLDPEAAARDLFQKAGPLAGHLRIAVVTGDDVKVLVSQMPDDTRLSDVDSRPFDFVRGHLQTANAYFGAAPMLEALRRGANVVITGRGCDASPTVAAAVHALGWSLDDYDRIAAATVAGHAIECGAHITGGNYSAVGCNPGDIPNPGEIGYPIADIYADGSVVITKPVGSGGLVTPESVKAQLVYEVSGNRYPTADVIADFSGLRVETVGDDRVKISGARGLAPTPYYKVVLSYLAGARLTTQCTYVGSQAFASAIAAGTLVPATLNQRGIQVDSLYRAVAGVPGSLDGMTNPRFSAKAGGRTFVPSATLYVGAFLQLQANDPKGEATCSQLHRAASILSSRVLSGPRGPVTYESGKAKTVLGCASLFIKRSLVPATVTLYVSQEGEVSAQETLTEVPEPQHFSPPNAIHEGQDVSSASEAAMYASYFDGFEPVQAERFLSAARSGDKGSLANVGLVAKNARLYKLLKTYLTPQLALAYVRSLSQGFETLNPSACRIYPNDGLMTLNLVFDGILGPGGGGCNPAQDTQGKGLAEAILYGLHIPLPLGTPMS